MYAGLLENKSTAPAQEKEAGKTSAIFPDPNYPANDLLGHQARRVFVFYLDLGLLLLLDEVVQRLRRDRSLVNHSLKHHIQDSYNTTARNFDCRKSQKENVMQFTFRPVI